MRTNHRGRTDAGIGISWGNSPRKRTRGIALLAITASVAGSGVATANNIPGTTYDPTYVPTSMYRATTSTGARSMWQAGYTGKGVDVAVIDTGVSPVQGLDAPGKIINGPDLSFDSQNPNSAADGYGHGTHLAGIIAGNDDGTFVYSKTKMSTANSATFYGMAPNARVLDMKVGASNGAADVTQVIASLNWIVQHKNDNGMNVKVICLAYSTDGKQDYRTDPLTFAVENAWKHGITVVVAAGNAGRNKNGVGRGLMNPAYDPFVLAVGAQDARGTTDPSDDRASDFSSNGPSDWEGRAPDLLAPGVSVPSLRSVGSYLDTNYGGTAVIGNRSFKGSGSSQAAAMVAGAAALIIQQHPTATPDEVKAILTAGAVPLANETPGAQGNGRMLLSPRAAAPIVDLAALAAIEPSTGTGSVDSSRGTHRLKVNNAELIGEIDIFGHPFDSAAVALSAGNATSWQGGSWNGSSWTGSSWTGSSWTGSSWTGSSWTGSSWTGSSWTGSSWTGSSWTGSSWTGDNWASALPPKKTPLKKAVRKGRSISKH
jgi:serine protease AprX